MSLKGKRKKTMFVDPSHKTLADIVKIDTPANARKSVIELKRRFRTLKHHDARVNTKMSCVLAANRAEAMALRKDLCSKERIELNAVKRIYRRAAREMRF